MIWPASLPAWPLSTVHLAGTARVCIAVHRSLQLTKHLLALWLQEPWVQCTALRTVQAQPQQALPGQLCAQVLGGRQASGQVRGRNCRGAHRLSLWEHTQGQPVQLQSGGELKARAALSPEMNSVARLNLSGQAAASMQAMCLLICSLVRDFASFRVLPLPTHCAAA